MIISPNLRQLRLNLPLENLDQFPVRFYQRPLGLQFGDDLALDIEG